jgi:regulator of replication initiation timing
MKITIPKSIEIINELEQENAALKKQVESLITENSKLKKAKEFSDRMLAKYTKNRETNADVDLIPDNE